MRAYHFLRADWTAGSGDEPPWTIGEERVIDGEIALCKRGYHYGCDWLVALSYAPGPVACVVDVDEGPPDSTGKGVSRRRKLIDGADCTRELRLFACDCATRALTRERNTGRGPDAWLWEAIEVSRRFANGKAFITELAVAKATVRLRPPSADAWVGAAAAAVADADAWVAADDTAVADARSAIWATSWDTERAWQRQRLAELLDARLAEVGPMEAQDA